MSGTYTLAEIHERHERLEEVARGIAAARMAPEAISLVVSPLISSGAGSPFEERLAGEFATVLPELLETMAHDLARQRQQLKTDATAAYVAFMGGE